MKGNLAEIIDENKQAILLLSSYFSSPRKGDPTPLTTLEYGRFALWLKENDYQPKDLFTEFDELCAKWSDPKGKITAERLRYLLGRGMAMGLALEKWQSAGVWFITRADAAYPSRLKSKLGPSAPAVLFGVGNKALLDAGGLAIVGSRHIDEADQQYTRIVGRQAALEGLNVVSGGARGVDETAMVAALEVDGTALGILANDLFKSALASKWRRYIRANQLALISPYYPDAPFHVGNAMGRNKHVYSLADYALVVRSEEGKGGTWSGAQENLRRKWVPLFVKEESDCTGNPILIRQGAKSLAAPKETTDQKAEWLLVQLDSPLHATLRENGAETDSVEESQHPDDPDRLFKQFLDDVRSVIYEDGEAKLARLKEIRNDLKQKQITDWLDRATAEGVLERKGRLRTYTLKADKKEQLDIFT